MNNKSGSTRFINTDSGLRISQACDRCRIKKTRCDGATPCSKCVDVGLECTVSDKLARRSFPKGYTVNLERRVKELEDEISMLKAQKEITENPKEVYVNKDTQGVNQSTQGIINQREGSIKEPSQAKMIPVNNPIDQIFNLDENGIIIGNDNLNFESQFNHLLINLKLPFLKITNSHNYLLNDPDSYLFHRSYTNFNNYHNKDLEIIYNPLTMKGSLRNQDKSSADGFPIDVYDLFIKLVSNFKKLFGSKKELDQQIIQFFLNYNTFIPILDYDKFMQGYDAFHTMYPFMFTYDDATINGFNLSSNDYQVVNEYLVLVIQIYAMISMNDPSLNLNLLLNHKSPDYRSGRRHIDNSFLVQSLYDFLPYLNVFHVSVDQLHTYLIFLYYSLITNNKEKSLVLSSLINSFIGILGVNLNCDNLFFNDLSLTLSQRRNRVKIFWAFKVLLKCFNLKFGFKPTINTTVINPVTIERYFKLTPEKLSSLLEPSTGKVMDSLFETLLAPSVEFLNLMNIVIPSSFSPNYYEYLKQGRPSGGASEVPPVKKDHVSHLDWILNDDDGDGNDGNLNYNYHQFWAIDKNLSNWRYSLSEKRVKYSSLQSSMGLSNLSSTLESSLYYRVSFEGKNIYDDFGISPEGLLHYVTTGLPDVHTAFQLIKMQLNFHYLMIRSMNYLNFVIERELTSVYYVKIANISREVLAFFVIIFQHVSLAQEGAPGINSYSKGSSSKKHLYDPFASYFDFDEDGFIVNDFSAKRNKKNAKPQVSFPSKTIPISPFNSVMNGLSLTIINFKKVIVLQMLYLLICNLKIAKKGGCMSVDTLRVLHDSITLFIRVFINYQPHAFRTSNIKQMEEFQLYKKIINDELKDDILSESGYDSDLEESAVNEIDWDDEDMDEDLKYLKILKYIKYKSHTLSQKKDSCEDKGDDKSKKVKLGCSAKGMVPDTAMNPGLHKPKYSPHQSPVLINQSSLMVQFSPTTHVDCSEPSSRNSTNSIFPTSEALLPNTDEEVRDV